MIYRKTPSESHTLLPRGDPARRESYHLGSVELCVIPATSWWRRGLMGSGANRKDQPQSDD